MGHGLRSALITAIMRGLVEELKSIAHDPGLFMTHINREFMTILRDAEEFMFVTASYVLIDLDQRRITFTDAGHPSPLLLRPSEKLVTPIRQCAEPSGPAIGILENASYESQHHSLEPGDSILIYTDGLSEAEGVNREEFGVDRLITSLRSHLDKPLENILPSVLADAEKHTLGRGFDDDVCLVLAQAAAFPS
jgi:serine phosphatase RsbU (regulator of sigma subunit)